MGNSTLNIHELAMRFPNPIKPLAVACMLLSSCTSLPPVSDGNALPTPEIVNYRCAEQVGITVTYAGRATGMQGTADLAWDGQVFPLKRDPDGGEARYTDGTLTLNVKGDEAFVEKAGEIVLRDCNAKVVSAQ